MTVLQSLESLKACFENSWYSKLFETFTLADHFCNAFRAGEDHRLAMTIKSRYKILVRFSWDLANMRSESDE